MDNISVFLAKFWGWYLIIFFLVLSFNPKRIKQIISNVRDEKFLLLVSFLAIVIGLLNILFHNIWELNWKLIITLFGWIALFEGIALFAFPHHFLPMIEMINIKFVQTLYLLLLFIGLYLLNIAYQIIPF